MSKTVNFDKCNFNVEWCKSSYGLLIGNKQNNNLNVFLPIECPIECNQNKDDNNVANPKWVGQHALNVFRMLPGNVTIVGCYAVTDHDTFNKNPNNLLAILSDVYSKEKKLNYDLFESNDPMKYFLLINPANLRFCCKKVDLSEEKSIFKNVDIKYGDVMNDYQSATSNISVKIDIVMPSERDKDLILRQLKDSVNPFITDFVDKSIMLVNGQQLKPETEFGSVIVESEIDPIRETNRGDMISDESSFANNLPRLELTFIGMHIQPVVDSTIDSESETDFEMINRVKIQGRIPGVAYLSTRATVADVELALKKDLTRSLYSRLELLTEELHITSGEMEVSQMLLPQRVKVMLPCCPKFPLSDYKFFSETAPDVISRVRYFCRPPGMSDDELDINCIDMGLEKSEQASLDDELSEVELPEEQSDPMGHSMNQSKSVVYFLGLSGLVFLISVIVYYIFN